MDRMPEWWYKNNKYKLFKWKVRYYDTKKRIYFEDTSYAVEKSAKEVLGYLEWLYDIYDNLEFKIVPSPINCSIVCNAKEHYDNLPSKTRISKKRYDMGFPANDLPMPTEDDLDYILITNFWLQVRDGMCKYE